MQSTYMKVVDGRILEVTSDDILAWMHAAGAPLLRLGERTVQAGRNWTAWASPWLVGTCLRSDDDTGEVIRMLAAYAPHDGIHWQVSRWLAGAAGAAAHRYGHAATFEHALAQALAASFEPTLHLDGVEWVPDAHDRWVAASAGAMLEVKPHKHVSDPCPRWAWSLKPNSEVDGRAQSPEVALERWRPTRDAAMGAATRAFTRWVGT